MKEILKCVKCGAYTMEEEHCGVQSVTPKPARWSPEDKYGKYRREAKRELLKEKGLL